MGVLFIYPPINPLLNPPPSQTWHCRIIKHQIRFRIDFKRIRDIKLNWHFIKFLSIVSSLLVTFYHSLRHSLHYCPRLYYCKYRCDSRHNDDNVAGLG